MATSFIIHGSTVTTLSKAKALRPFVERLITKGIKYWQSPIFEERIGKIRHIRNSIHHSSALRILTQALPKLFSNRNGGYTRILKLGRRSSDAAPMAMIQMVLDDLPTLMPSVVSGDLTPLFRSDRYRKFCEQHTGPKIYSKEVRKVWDDIVFPRILITKIEGSFDPGFSLSFAESSEVRNVKWPRFAGISLLPTMRVIINGTEKIEKAVRYVEAKGDALLIYADYLSGVYEFGFSACIRELPIAIFHCNLASAFQVQVYTDAGFNTYRSIRLY